MAHSSCGCSVSSSSGEYKEELFSPEIAARKELFINCYLCATEKLKEGYKWMQTRNYLCITCYKKEQEKGGCLGEALKSMKYFTSRNSLRLDPCCEAFEKSSPF